MTETCRKCEFREICEELEYPMDQENVEECEHYDACLEGKYQALEALWECE